jgi:8-oxo-dGTP pyrophosphatase MutT (NUDIX family)
MSWARCTDGHTHWGPRGAAGLLVAEGGRLLLQLRASWAHQGGTWSVPGGARERGETAVEAALREAHEELGLHSEAVDVRGSWVALCGGWSYETVLAVPRSALRIVDRSESEAHAWVTSAEVDDLPLHPAFRAAWATPATGLRAFVESV